MYVFKGNQLKHIFLTDEFDLKATFVDSHPENT